MGNHQYQKLPGESQKPGEAPRGQASACIKEYLLLISCMDFTYSKVASLVSKKIAELRVKAKVLYGIEIDPIISYDLRGLSAGQANCRENKIRLNCELLEKHAADFVNHTVPHELAHLIAHRVYGHRINPHGNEWRSVMKSLGVDPSRTHKYEVSKTRQIRRYTYYCNCPDKKHELTSIRHNRIRRGTKYLCGRCKGFLHQDLGE